MQIDETGKLIVAEQEVPMPSNNTKCIRWTFRKYVLLLVDAIEKDFAFEKRSDEKWVITVRCEGLGKERFSTNYVFYRELEIIGKANSTTVGRDEWEDFIKVIDSPPDRILILKQKA